MLTKQQLKLYKLMSDYRQRNEHMPSYDEMMDMMGLKSKSGIHRLIKGLEQRGALTRLPNHARAIKLRPLSSVMGVE